MCYQVVTNIYKNCRHFQNSVDPLVPYDYYFRVFHNEFGHKLGFEPPKTDCCNVCVSYVAGLKKYRRENNEAEVLRLETEHREHLTIAFKRREDMNTDFGERDVEDIQLDHTIIEHDRNGNPVEENPIDYIIIQIAINYLHHSQLIIKFYYDNKY